MSYSGSSLSRIRRPKLPRMVGDEGVVVAIGSGSAWIRPVNGVDSVAMAIDNVPTAMASGSGWMAREIGIAMEAATGSGPWGALDGDPRRSNPPRRC